MEQEISLDLDQNKGKASVFSHANVDHGSIIWNPLLINLAQAVNNIGLNMIQASQI
jgi:hypothetical protein